MTKYLSSLFLFISVVFFAQNQVKVFNKADKKPIHNAAVYCDDALLGKTDFNGSVSFKTKCKKVEILASNFQDVVTDVKPSMEVSMQPLSEKWEI
jgi:hypothetical protein